MKVFGIILIVLVLAAVCGVGYIYLTARLDIQFVSCIAADGVSQSDTFNTLKSKLATSSFIGTRFSDAELESPEKYQFLTYTVRLNNQTFLKAELIEIRITPMKGDILQAGDETPHNLSSGETAELSAVILTPRDMHAVREATVSYYFWGIPFTTRLTLG